MKKLSEKEMIKLLIEAIEKDVEKEQMEYCDEDDLEHDGPKKDWYTANDIRNKALKAMGRDPYSPYNPSVFDSKSVLNQSDTIKIGYIVSIFDLSEAYSKEEIEERVLRVLLSMDAAKKYNQLHNKVYHRPTQTIADKNRKKAETALRRKKKGKKFSEPSFVKNITFYGKTDNSDYYRNIVNDPNRFDLKPLS